jgi:DNA-binding transcriptional MerR regulator
VSEASEAGGPRRANKSASAFRTIGEVAEDLDVPAHVLRFWESKFSQLKPLKRGGGRRYYRPEDVVLLRRIRQCLYQDGYTIRGVQKLLREGGPADAETEAGLEGEPGSEGMLFPLDPDALPSEVDPAEIGPPALTEDTVGSPGLRARPGRRPPPRALPEPVRIALEEIATELIEIRGLLVELMQRNEPR